MILTLIIGAWLCHFNRTWYLVSWVPCVYCTELETKAMPSPCPTQPYGLPLPPRCSHLISHPWGHFSATLAFLLFLTRLEDPSAPEPLHLLFSLPDIHMAPSLTSFKSLPKCPFLNAPPLIHLIFNCSAQSLLHPQHSPAFFPPFMFSFLALTTFNRWNTLLMYFENRLSSHRPYNSHEGSDYVFCYSLGLRNGTC